MEQLEGDLAQAERQRDNLVARQNEIENQTLTLEERLAPASSRLSQAQAAELMEEYRSLQQIEDPDAERQAELQAQLSISHFHFEVSASLTQERGLASHPRRSSKRYAFPAPSQSGQGSIANLKP